jgi:N-acetylmuramoyl-L-alanine amidase
VNLSEDVARTYQHCAFCSLLFAVVLLSSCSLIEHFLGTKAAPLQEDNAERAGANGETSKKIFRVALDIGHTPKAPGAVGADGTVEYDFNRNIVSQIAATLRQQPLSVEVINQTGKEIGLAQRSQIANIGKADLLLSIHHDSVNDKYLVAREVDGQTYYQTDKFRGYSVFFSEKNDRQQESLKFARLLGAAMRDQGFIPTRHHAEKIQGENRDLLIPELGVYRFDDLVVLKQAQMPAALLECGVIVNPNEEAELKQPEAQAKIVAAATTAILQMSRGSQMRATARGSR